MDHHVSFAPEPEPIGQPCEYSQDTCTKTGCQYVDISVPIQLSPQTVLDKVEMECCGEPTVSCQDSCCKNTVEFVVTQRIRIKFPIHYMIHAYMGESVLDCAGCEETMEP